MISVVIPAYNEEKTIGASLDSLVNQTTKQPFEVIVVDNNSTDGTVKKVQEYNKKLQLRIVHERRKGRGPARAAGFDAAHGEIILSTDADTYVPANWIEEITRPFNDPQIVAVTGTSKISDCSFITNKLYNFVQPGVMMIYSLIFRHYWLSGFSFAIRKDAYRKSGGFSKILNGFEDTDLGFKVRNLGKISFKGDIPVTCSGRRFREGFAKGAFAYSYKFLDYYMKSKIAKKKNVYLSDIR